MKNKQLIITVGVLAAIIVASYIAYTVLKGGTSASANSPHKTQVAATAKQVAQAKIAAQQNPNDAVSQKAYLDLGKSLVSALITTNKVAAPAIKPDGTPITTVDSNGSYIENSDPSTLYDANGNVIGNLDPNDGMFVSPNGVVIAAQDGSPVTNYNDANGTYTDNTGQAYTMDGTAINLNSDGSYTEVGDSTVYDVNGNAVDTTATSDNTDYSNIDNSGDYASAIGIRYK